MIVNNIQEYIVELNYRELAEVIENEKVGKLYYKLLRLALDCSYHPESHYKKHTIYKRDGSKREISVPDKTISRHQKWIKNNILDQISISDSAFAYVRGRSGKDAAQMHFEYMKANPDCCMIHLDIKEFFNSITANKVYDALRNELNVTDELLTFITNIVCLNGRVPQGATTSPVLSNICFKELDERIEMFAKQYKMLYTRYSDDIYISFAEESIPIKNLIALIKKTLNERGYRLNTKKTRVIKKGQRYAVLGINTEKVLQVSRRYRNNIRKEMYYIKKHGVESHLRYTIPLNNNVGYNEQLRLIDEYNLIETQKKYLERMNGKILYCLFVNPDDKDMQKYFEEVRLLLSELSKREHEEPCEEEPKRLFQDVERIFKDIDNKWGYPEWELEFDHDELYLQGIDRYLRNNKVYSNINLEKSYARYELITKNDVYEFILRINSEEQQIKVEMFLGDIPLMTIEYGINKDLPIELDLLAIEQGFINRVPEIKDEFSDNYLKAIEVGRIVSRIYTQKQK